LPRGRGIVRLLAGGTLSSPCVFVKMSPQDLLTVTGMISKGCIFLFLIPHLFSDKGVYMASFDPTCRRDLKSSASAINGIKRAGFFSLAYLAVDCYNGSSNDEKVAPGMIMKEEHEASEVET
jgi:hypothetical protein